MLPNPENAWLAVHDKAKIAPIDHIWNEFCHAFGNRWRSNFSSENSVEGWRKMWGMALESEKITQVEASSGLAICTKTFEWPPSLAEFLAVCRPPVDLEALFCASAKALQDGIWPSKLAFWATQEVGPHEVRNEPFKRIETRWRRAVEELQKVENLPNIRVRDEKKSLPAPSKLSSMEATAKTTAICREITDKNKRAWAKKIMESPDSFPGIAKKFASEVLGQQL